MNKTVALCGCPNCGKTTLFNLLTGEARKTGNWSGVTVDVGTGMLTSRFAPSADACIRICDLPGAASLYPHSPEESAALAFLKGGGADAVILVLDSCAPAQGLYLALQLLPLHLPLILAFNMSDRLKASGGAIRLKGLSRALGVPCIPISARRHENVGQLIKAALSAPVSQGNIPFEENASTERRLALSQMRYELIDRLLRDFFSFSAQTQPISPLDRIALHPLLAYPLLAAVLAALFFTVFGLLGQTVIAYVSSVFEKGLTEAALLLTDAHTPPLLFSLLTEGLLRSVANVLSFLPLLLLFFFVTALIEDSGYLSRAAFLLDAPLSRIGLSGRSFFSLIAGFGCSVPALLSTRMLPDKAERERALRLIPFIPCSAKQPVCLFMTALCFSQNPAFFLILCYVLCLLFFLLAALLPPSPGKVSFPTLMNEMPAYHVPTLRGAWNAMKNKTRDYISRAFTVIFFTSLIVWFLRTFTLSLTLAQDAQSSLLFALSRVFQPVLAPLGFASPYTVAALISGLLAKENILAVLLIAPVQEELFPSPAAALSFLVFSLLYAPCLAACAAAAQELKSRKHMLLSVVLQTVFAWLAAWMIFTVFSR
ncbi:MAG: ferrous iron transporter B [Clostridia bacterium]|nr:ferrous iron transporter B [Clostridia bacterium]